MMDVRAAIGDENLIRGFWLVIGSIVISNIGMIVGAIISFFRKQIKMKKDIRAAHDKIRAICKHFNLELEKDSVVTDLKKGEKT